MHVTRPIFYRVRVDLLSFMPAASRAHYCSRNCFTGQAFLTGLKGVPDMTKLSANLDKQACPPVSTDQQRSGSSSPAETVDHSNATNGHGMYTLCYVTL